MSSQRARRAGRSGEVERAWCAASRADPGSAQSRKELPSTGQRGCGWSVEVSPLPAMLFEEFGFRGDLVHGLRLFVRRPHLRLDRDVRSFQLLDDQRGDGPAKALPEQVIRT